MRDNAEDPQAYMTVYSIGHSTRPIERFIELIRMTDGDRIIDVRRFPYSRRQPQFNIENLSKSLAGTGIDYMHLPVLGGLRSPLQSNKPSSNTLWRQMAFRNYADYAETEEFQKGLQQLIAFTLLGNPIMMCTEAQWWRCHRRIITDYLLAGGIEVKHILDDRIETALLTLGATILPDRRIAYSTTPLLSGL